MRMERKSWTDGKIGIPPFLSEVFQLCNFKCLSGLLSALNPLPVWAVRASPGPSILRLTHWGAQGAQPLLAPFQSSVIRTARCHDLMCTAIL